MEMEAINSIGYKSGGDFGTDQSQGAGALSSVRSGVASVFEGIGNISCTVGDGLMQMGAQISGIDGGAFSSTNMMRMYYNGGWGCGWGCGWGPGIGIWGYPMLFGPVDFGTFGYGGGGFSGSSSSFGGAGSAQRDETVPVHNPGVDWHMVGAMADALNVGPTSNIDVKESFVPIYNPGSAAFDSSFALSLPSIPSATAEAQTLLNKADNPSAYASDGTLAAYAKDPLNKPFSSIDPKTGAITTPSWYRSLANKIEQKKELTSDEKILYQQYNKLFRTYSPYELNEYFDMKVDEAGQRIPTTIYEELNQLQHLFAGKHREEIEEYINSCSPEKLAALELHYQKMPFAGGRTLRESIKDACIVSWFEWSGWNTDRCARIFDKLDEAASLTPTNMKIAIQQTLNNHRMGGFGHDSDRLNKLLRQAISNPLFKKYLRTEYPNIVNDINKKWYRNDETEQLVKELLS